MYSSRVQLLAQIGPFVPDANYYSHVAELEHRTNPACLHIERSQIERRRTRYDQFGDEVLTEGTPCGLLHIKQWPPTAGN